MISQILSCPFNFTSFIWETQKIFSVTRDKSSLIWESEDQSVLSLCQNSCWFIFSNYFIYWLIDSALKATPAQYNRTQQELIFNPKQHKHSWVVYLALYYTNTKLSGVSDIVSTLWMFLRLVWTLGRFFLKPCVASLGSYFRSLILLSLR